MLTVYEKKIHQQLLDKLCALTLPYNFNNCFNKLTNEWVIIQLSYHFDTNETIKRIQQK